MNYWRILAIIFSVLVIGAFQETARIFTSDAPDIVENRDSLKPMAVGLTIVIIGLAVFFWKKSMKRRV